MACGNACVDIGIDMSNCGACAAPCSPGHVCTSGKCNDPTADWPMFGRDALHSGVNLDETGRPPAVDAWETQIATTAARLSPAVVEGGRLFVTAASRFADRAPLVALNVADGSKLWEYNFGAVDSVGHPSAFKGSVYVQTNKGLMGSSYLWSIDEVAGTVKWSAVFGSQWENFWAPAIAGSTVYIDGGNYGGLYGFSTTDGSQLFFNSGVGQYDSWSPAVFQSNVYTFIAGKFGAHDPANGNTLWTVTTNWTWTGYSMNTAPVFGTSLAYVIAPPNLVAIDPSKQAVAWTANGTYTGTPAVSGSAVYGISGGNLIARDALTGMLLWTFVGDTLLSYPPIVANGFAYVSSSAHVYAVDLTTHMTAWSAPVGGWLTVGAGRLLVAGADGVMRGYVLSP
jgi:PQQ-like domain/Stigma-specific protein, Stig1